MEKGARNPGDLSDKIIGRVKWSAAPASARRGQRIGARDCAPSARDVYATEASSGRNFAPERWRHDGEMRYTVAGRVPPLGVPREPGSAEAPIPACARCP